MGVLYHVASRLIQLLQRVSMGLDLSLKGLVFLDLSLYTDENMQGIVTDITSNIHKDNMSGHFNSIYIYPSLQF